MVLPKYIAIDLLCQILDEVPEPRRFDAVTFACIAVGQSAEPTGLKRTRTRTIGQMYWDVTTADLRKRLIYLVDTVDVEQQTLVHGVIGFLDNHFATHANRDFVEGTRENHVNTMERIDADLQIPLEQRESRMRDDELIDFKKKMEQSYSDIEKRRQEAEEALHYLRERVESVFTMEFWQAFTISKLGDPRRLLDLEEPDEDEDAASSE